MTRCSYAWLASLLLVPTGCPDDGVADSGAGDSDGSTADVGEDTDGGSDAGSGAGSDAAVDETGEDPGEDTLSSALLLSRLPGLWAAPVTSETSVGNFPLMNMDLRAADARTLFSRVDLDSDNNLRFAFAYEAHPDLGRVLVYRNGGFFQGVLRDTRTYLVEFDDASDTWRFCAIAGGCGYIDAHLSVTEGGALDLDVNVLRMHHIHWAPTRVETRELPEPFPDGEPGDATEPFPLMPALDAGLSWPNAADEGEVAWLLLFTEPCMIMAGACNPARFYRAAVEAGQNEVVLSIDQIHAGDYYGIAVLDRNDNLAGTLLPDAGDAISLLNVPVAVAAEGTSTTSIQVMLEF